MVNTTAVYPTDKASNRALNKDVWGLEDLIDTIVTVKINISGAISINWSPQIGVGSWIWGTGRTGRVTHNGGESRAS